MKYKKTLQDLEKVAIKWWPKALEAQVAEASVIPKLLETQEEFIAILKLSSKQPEQIFKAIEVSNLAPNCQVPCDYVPRRSWPLFRARELMHGVIASFKHKEPKP